MSNAGLVNFESRGGLSMLRLSGAQSTLEIALQGAHVTGWSVPGTPPVLFLSPHAIFEQGKAIRGGVPLVFPWFGPRPGAAQHGFARVRKWSLQDAAVDADGRCTVAMTLAADERTRAAWPHAFLARFTASAGRELRMGLEVRNTGAAAFTFEAALHTYLAVSDVRRIRVHGLESADYLDQVGGSARKRSEGAPLTFTGETDRVYLDTAGVCTIEDPGWKRRVAVSKSGSRSTVVWNPWSEKARAMADLGESAWSGMVCVETANAGDDARTLAPGDSHVLEALITVQTQPPIDEGGPR